MTPSHASSFSLFFIIDFIFVIRVRVSFFLLIRLLDLWFLLLSTLLQVFMLWIWFLRLCGDPLLDGCHMAVIKRFFVHLG